MLMNKWYLLLIPFIFDYSWDRLHACRTPTTLQATVNEYVESFPCEECREHFAELVDTHPFPLEHVHTEGEARVWTWLTHNLVNQRLGKDWHPLEEADPS